MFEKQLQHVIALAALLCGVFVLADESCYVGRVFDISSAIWFYTALAVPVLHQVYVWLAWRSQLHHTFITRKWGDKGFIYYCIGFSILIGSRLLFIIVLAWANRGTLPMSKMIAWPLASGFFLLAVYLGYSVHRYFGHKRAYGIDHFDESFRKKPFVRKGIFRWSGNAMYTFGFLILWAPGLLFLSKAALLVAAFSHAYIWVHYYCTELPDIKRIYG